MKGMAAWLPRSRSGRRRDRRAAAPRAVRAVREIVGGSYEAHESLVAACLQLLGLHRVPATPIVTGPKVRPRPAGGFELRRNPLQKGFGDIAAALPPEGRLLLIDCKTGNASRSPEQITLHEKFETAGALCVVIRNATELLPIIKRSRWSDRDGDSSWRPR
jgi:hypothetical protein